MIVRFLGNTFVPAGSAWLRSLTVQRGDLSCIAVATRGTAAFLAEQGLDVSPINKVLEGRPHIVDAMKNGDVQLVVNTTEGEKSLADSKSIRRTALVMKIPYYTTMAGAEAAVAAIRALSAQNLGVRSSQDYAGAGN